MLDRDNLSCVVIKCRNGKLILTIAMLNSVFSMKEFSEKMLQIFYETRLKSREQSSSGAIA